MRKLWWREFAWGGARKWPAPIMGGSRPCHSQAFLASRRVPPPAIHCVHECMFVLQSLRQTQRPPASGANNRPRNETDLAYLSQNQRRRDTSVGYYGRDARPRWLHGTRELSGGLLGTWNWWWMGASSIRAEDGLMPLDRSNHWSLRRWQRLCLALATIGVRSWTWFGWLNSCKLEYWLTRTSGIHEFRSSKFMCFGR